MRTGIYDLLNLPVLSRLKRENNLHPDPAEGARRNQMLEELQDNVLALLSEYDNSVWDYDRRHAMEEFLKKGFRPIPLNKATATKAWDNRFGRLVTRAQKNRVYNYSEQFRWHLFSFGLLPALAGNDARRAFFSIPKNTLWVFFQISDQAIKLENARRLKASDLDALHALAGLEEADVYIFDPQNDWTYVLTHESTCGPYFYRVGM